MLYVNMLIQYRLNLAQFDTITPQLDLVVDAA